MDTRNMDRYESFDDAKKAGVPDAFIGEVRHSVPNGEIVVFHNGPFKGRTYKRVNGQLVRQFDHMGRDIAQ